LSPIATILSRVTEELRKVAGRLDAVQGAVSLLVLDSVSPRSSHFRDLQDLDRATQEIAAIAAFLEKLGSDLPSDWLADPKGASLSVDLHELAAILGHHEPGEAPAREVVEHEYEIFD
jgi:hypothetical protein